MSNDKMYSTEVMAKYSPEEYVEKLRKQNAELAASLTQLTSFQERLCSLRAASCVDDALDTMELLLEDIVEVIYLRLYFGSSKDESMTLVREMCPEDYPLDWQLVHWAMEKNELAFIPCEIKESELNEEIKNLLILPLIGHSEEVGVLLIWVDIAMDEFTQERSTLLTMLAREVASVLESLRLQKRIHEGHAAIADIVENIPMGIMAVDNHNRLTVINGTAEFIFKISRNEVTNQPLSEVLPQPLHRQVSSILDQSAESTYGEGEVELNISGEEEDVFGLSVGRLHGTEDVSSEEEDTAGHVIVCRDLKLSREVAKLRELDAMKNDFLSLVSHELRTPLTSIMAYSETLLMEGMVETEEERREYLEIIHSEGDRLSRLINDVLDLTKMESGKMDYIYGEMEIEEVVRSSIATVHSLAAPKGMNMPVDIEEGLPAIKADRDKIVQVLTNFYSNAIKFTDQGGSISTRCRRCVDEEMDNLEVIEVAVQDTGMGIPESEIHKVFSKFEQVEKIDHHSVGTGLGMPICRLIIEEGHAGRTWIESEVGVGTTVFFRIPIG
ncbi:MAG: ATP-binding protein [Planctomycetota bacterium]|jgi:signal transduction histidine kinase